VGLKVIPLAEAIGIVKQSIHESGCNLSEETVLKHVLSSVDRILVDTTVYVDFNKLRNFLTNFMLAVEEKDSTILTMKRGLRVEHVAGIEEFITSKDLMNQKRDVRPAILKTLVEFWHTPYYVEAILAGGIGIGKNYWADMSLAYMLYKASCYYNPQLEYGLAPGSSIVLIQQSKTEKLAKKVVFEQFAERLRLSKYFVENFMFDTRIKSELRFPNNIFVLPVGGSCSSALGMNVLGGCIDEMNYMDIISNSAQAKHGESTEYDQAERLYNILIRRMKSRYMSKGKMPGRLMLISSSNYEGDFTDRKEKEAEEQKKKYGRSDIYVMHLSQWEALPDDKFCGDKFLVEIGDANRRSKLIRCEADAVNKEKIIRVPVEYKPEFERDIEGALKDLGGIAVGSKSPFIPYKERIIEAHTKFIEQTKGKSLFKYLTVKLSNNMPDFSSWEEWDELVDVDYIETCLFNTQQAFAGHLDIGLNKDTGDAAGLCIGHISGFTQLDAYKYFDPRLGSFIESGDIEAPVYMLDGLLQITAHRGDEVDLNLVRDLIFYIKQKINLKWMSMDTYQSRTLIQSFRRAGIRSGNLSVDTSIAPYTELKLSIKDSRILYPNHPIFEKEIREIERDPKKNKVDHPPHGSKDVADAAAGCVFILQTKETQYTGSRQNRQEVLGAQRIRKLEQTSSREHMRGGIL
jgi:hypothetical protein